MKIRIKTTSSEAEWGKLQEETTRPDTTRANSLRALGYLKRPNRIGRCPNPLNSVVRLRSCCCADPMLPWIQTEQRGQSGVQIIKTTKGKNSVDFLSRVAGRHRCGKDYIQCRTSLTLFNKYLSSPTSWLDPRFKVNKNSISAIPSRVPWSLFPWSSMAVNWLPRM
jgi:hypothetical protein